MAVHDPKANLKEYLQGGRDTLLWKLSGLSEYDIRRPLVPTGTNLLGLVKHKAHSEFVYLGDTFERPSGEPLTWFQSAEPNADMWATADESRQEIVELYQRAWTHSDATIAALTLDSIGHVPHWPAGQDTQRHAGQADIIRELIDGAVGLLKGHDNMPPADRRWWDSHRDRLQRVAEAAGRD